MPFPLCRQCHRPFRADPRVGDSQKTCSRPVCQRARQRAKLRRWRALHPDRAQSHPSKVRAWAKAFPDYWRRYRRGHPAYRVRDNERRQHSRHRLRRAAKETLIAEIYRRKLEALEGLQAAEVSAKETPIDRRMDIVVDYLVWKERAAKEALWFRPWQPAHNGRAMDAALWAEIKRLHGIEKLAIAEIGRRLHLDRKTVRQAVKSERLPERKTPVRRPSILEPYKPYIVERLKAYPRLPATVLFQELKKQGYPGQIRIVRKLVHTLRVKAPEVFLRIETPPGEQAQCDWANIGTVTIGKATRRLSAFLMILSHSRLLYVEFTLSQCLQDFIQCHINAFRAFGGIVRKVLYDNLKLVVLSRLGKEIRFNPKFMEFAGVYGFEPVPCNVARGNEKGKVENSVHYLRANFLSGRELHWPLINADVHAWLQDTANVRLHRTTQERPVDRWERERPFLLAPPARPYDASIIRTVRSSHQALIRFDGNLYSVPAAHAYKTLLLKATATDVRLFLDAKEIAVHVRSYDRGQLVDNPKHYEGILATKRKHFHNILHKRFLELGETAKVFLEGLVQAEVQPARHLQQILNLVSAYGKDEVLAAMAHAISCSAFGGVYVQNILLQRRVAQRLPEIAPLEIPQRPDWNELITEEPDLSIYDQALEGESPSNLPDRSKDPPAGEDEDGPEAIPV